LLLLAPLASSCGGAPKDAAAPVVIPEQAPAPPAPLARSDDAGAPEAAAPRALPAGSNGPRDAVGMIGDAGKVFPDEATTVLLVNSAVMRAHPLGTRAMQLLTSVLVGWDQFMPIDLVHPVRDLDWVLLAGTLVMGSTRNAVFVSRYNVPEAKADLVSAELMKRLANGKKTKLGVAGVTSFTATVDGAERAYVRPKAGVLAIVPAADGKRTAELLATADVATAPRPGELVRIAWPRASRAPLPVPRAVRALRIWINGAAKDELTIAAEGECSDEAAALAAADDLRSRLRARAPGFARAVLRPVIDDAAIWADGNVVRYEAKLPEALLEMAAGLACMQATGKADCTR
ncbi:MAG TPA: hypothetical protein VLT33_30470, partial [Labilithrix sp.]|nr:hypothetical protein [Labilithrix sp.]